MSSRPFFTVFTPTYNRAHLLGRAYQSLCEQDFPDFEWVVVDDGSEDHTGELIKQWQQQAHFPIRYRFQPNSGKHVAINRAVELAEGELMIILDSDDWLVRGALESVQQTWQAIPDDQRSQFAGVVGLYAFSDGQVVGRPFPQSPLDTDALELQFRFRVRGDKFGANRVEVLREFPFPEDLGRFVPESLVWNRIALRYRLRCVNKVWAHKQYHTDGLSSRMVQIRSRSPLAARQYYRELLEAAQKRGSVPLSIRLRASANYVRFSLHAGIPVSQLRRDLSALGGIALGLTVGTVAYYRDQRLLKGRGDAK